MTDCFLNKLCVNVHAGIRTAAFVVAAVELPFAVQGGFEVLALNARHQAIPGTRGCPAKTRVMSYSLFWGFFSPFLLWPYTKHLEDILDVPEPDNTICCVCRNLSPQRQLSVRPGDFLQGGVLPC